MLSLEGDEEVKERKILKISTPKKLLTRLVILLNKNWKQFLQIKKWNQTNTTSLYQHNKITKKSLQEFNEVIIIIRDPKTFYFNFDPPKDVDENLKNEIEYITKNNESLTENKKKSFNNYCPNISNTNNINNTHEHKKLQNKWNS